MKLEFSNENPSLKSKQRQINLMQSSNDSHFPPNFMSNQRNAAKQFHMHKNVTRGELGKDNLQKEDLNKTEQKHQNLDQKEKWHVSKPRINKRSNGMCFVLGNTLVQSAETRDFVFPMLDQVSFSDDHFKHIINTTQKPFESRNPGTDQNVVSESKPTSNNFNKSFDEKRRSNTTSHPGPRRLQRYTVPDDVLIATRKSAMQKQKTKPRLSQERVGRPKVETEFVNFQNKRSETEGNLSNIVSDQFVELKNDDTFSKDMASVYNTSNYHDNRMTTSSTHEMQNESHANVHNYLKNKSQSQVSKNKPKNTKSLASTNNSEQFVDQRRNKKQEQDPMQKNMDKNKYNQNHYWQDDSQNNSTEPNFTYAKASQEFDNIEHQGQKMKILGQRNKKILEEVEYQEKNLNIKGFMDSLNNENQSFGPNLVSNNAVKMNFKLENEQYK